MFVNYNESILSYISSIRKFYGLDSSYKSNIHFDKLINERKPEKIFIFLIDGLGYNLIARKLDDNSFLKRHLKYKTTTVFPSTTTSATTSIQNGKSPNQNAWLGWNEYIKEVDDIIIPFWNLSAYQEKDYGDGFIDKLIPVKTTVQELNEKGINARRLFPDFDLVDGCKDLEEMIERLCKYSYSDEYQHIYAYFDKYDSLMHRYGPDSKEADEYIKYIDDNLKRFETDFNKDTMLVIVADHGQIQIEKKYDIYKSPFNKYLRRPIYIEPRATAFDIKEGMHEEFRKEFIETFEEDFILLNKQQMLETKLFGEGENHPKLNDLLSDFIAIGKSKMVFNYSLVHEGQEKGHHAGIQEDELLIPIVLL